LHDFLKSHRITDVYIAGLATEYCVKYSVLDALKLGFTVHVIEDACRGIDLEPGDCRKAIEEMRTAGAHITDSTKILQATD
jgi:nicotinamidase/pyrazinamidase